MARRSALLLLVGLIVGTVIGACSTYLYLAKTSDHIYIKAAAVFLDYRSEQLAACIISSKSLESVFGRDLDYSKLYSTINSVVDRRQPAGRWRYINSDFWPNTDAMLEYGYEKEGPNAEGSFTLLYLSPKGPLFCTVTFNRTGSKFVLEPVERKNWKLEYGWRGTIRNLIWDR